MPPGQTRFEARRERLSVFVRGLAIQAQIGVYPHERGRLQPLIVDVELELAPATVAAIADTVNYETVVLAAVGLAEEGHIELVETFAHRLAAACLAHPRVLRCRVRVEKPQAIADAQGAGVEIVLANGEGRPDEQGANR